MGDRVFISYSRDDEDFALRLATNLKNQGVPIWLDQWDIQPGDDWPFSIEYALYNCAYLLFILSPSSVESKTSRNELQFALGENKIVIPIYYKPCHIPFMLKSYQYIDFTSHSPDDKSLIKKLLKALNRNILALNAMEKKEATKDDLNDEIGLSRVWTSKVMSGRWDGTAKWNLEDKTWEGIGSWKGGLLFGSWNIKGKWEHDGTCNGDGEFYCNMNFMKNIEHYAIIMGIVLSIIGFELSHFLTNFSLNVGIIAALLLIVLIALVIWIMRSTTKGKARLIGTWQDVGKFRIVDIQGEARLGYHTGTLSGKIKGFIKKI